MPGRSWISWFLLVILAIIWGGSFILIKKALIAFSPVQVACMRITISALAFLPFAFHYFKKVSFEKWKFLLIVGLAGSGIPSFLFAVAQTKIDSSIAGILNSLTPLFTLLLGILIFKDKVVVRKIMGVFIGLAGATFLIWFSSHSFGSGSAGLGLLIVLATILYAISVNTVKHKLQDMHPLTISTISFSMIGPPAMIYLAYTNPMLAFQENTQAWISLGSVFILAIFGTVIGSVLFFRLIQMTDAVFSASVSYLIPIVALLLAIWDGELLTIIHLLGMLMILSGVYLSKNRKLNNSAPASD